MLLLLFQLNDKKYGINTEHVVEVIPVVEFKSIPNTPSYVSGAFQYRGTVVPVVDLSLLINNSPSTVQLSTRLVLIRIKKKIIGFIAEKMTDMLELEECEFEGLETINKSEMFGPIVKKNQIEIQMLNIDSLVPSSIIEQL